MSEKRLITFASSEADIRAVMALGFKNIILEDSKLSVRSFHNDFDSKDFKKLETLAALARDLDPDVSLSFNCDLLTHTQHEATLSDLIPTLKAAKILEVRLQDPGLSVFFKDYYPECKLILNTETSNANTESLRYYLADFERIVLSNELPASAIHTLFSALPDLQARSEIVLQAPLLLQYSPRRFLTGYYQKSAIKSEPIIIRKSQAKEYPGRFFTFMDNPHGHFMFSYFDRSLIKMQSELRELNCNYWIIDYRNRGYAYLKVATAAFQNEIEPNEAFSKLQEISDTAQKPGFFKINNTDRGRQKKGALVENEIELGTVLDMVKEKWLTVEVKRPFSTEDSLFLKTPDGKSFSINAEHMTSIWGDAIQTGSAGSLIKLRWRKGAQVKSKLIKVLN